MEVSKIISKGQVTIPKPSLIALRDLQEAISKDAEEKGITEEDLLNELDTIRQEMWNERKK